MGVQPGLNDFVLVDGSPCEVEHEIEHHTNLAMAGHEKGSFSGARETELHAC
jgi:hypothetical protein